jgi:hypothetical protein
MALDIPHSKNRNYFSLYFIIPNQTKVADKNVRSQAVCVVYYVPIFGMMSHFFKKKLVKFNLNFMYKIYRK